MARAADRLLHLGNVIIDVVMHVPALPERGGDVFATGADTTPGGGFNVMLAARRQGLAVAYAGAHGTGLYGDRVRAALRDAGIAVIQQPNSRLDTGFCVGLVDSGGERTYLTTRGAEATLGPEHLAKLRPGARDLVYLSGYGMLHPENQHALMGWLPTLPDDVTVVYDPGPLGHLVPGDVRHLLLHRTDWWSCNAEEAARATGRDHPLNAAAELSRRTGRHGVLVRTGPDGCLVSHHSTVPVHVPGFAVPVVDTSGAGDTHTGTFLAAIAAGADPIDAARTANAAAALSVTVRGPATAPTAEELVRFLAGRAQGTQPTLSSQSQRHSP
jgi:sugar/nucleoside kinase (ribokinase family)